MGSQSHVEVMPVAERSSSRFRLVLKIASGGMGTVYLGQQRGAAGFQRLVAIKKAHPHLLEDEKIARMLVMEARLASLVRHPHVVGVTDVEDANGELLLVMEYVEGASLAELICAPGAIPLGVALRLILDSCEGLEALHRAEDEEGYPLGLVHRDVSPQNVLVGVDGLARLTDFGIARACAIEDTTAVLRGKPSYMSPEYAASAKATPSSDVFALGVVAWETLTQQRLYKGVNDVDAAERVRAGCVPLPSVVRPGIPPVLDDVILKAVSGNPEERFASARAFSAAIVATTRNSSDWGDRADLDPEAREPWIASRAEVGAYVASRFEAKLHARREMLRRETPVDPWRPSSQFAILAAASASASSASAGEETPRPITTDALPMPVAAVRKRTSGVRRALIVVRAPLIASVSVCAIMLVASSLSHRAGDAASALASTLPKGAAAPALPTSDNVVVAAAATTSAGPRPPVVAPSSARPARPIATAAPQLVPSRAPVVLPAPPVVVASPKPEVVTPRAAPAPAVAAPPAVKPLLLAPPASAPENPY